VLVWHIKHNRALHERCSYSLPWSEPVPWIRRAPAAVEEVAPECGAHGPLRLHGAADIPALCAKPIHWDAS